MQKNTLDENERLTNGLGHKLFYYYFINMMNTTQNHLEKLIEIQSSLKQYIKARNESIKISCNPPQ